MADLIITGASRGIGRALSLAMARRRPADRQLLLARSSEQLRTLGEALRAGGVAAEAIEADLSSLAGARRAAEALAQTVHAGATLVHNAGLWPSRLQRTPEGLEQAFVVNHLAPLILQRPLLDRGRLNQILVVGAGLMVKGRFDAARTPTGKDFSGIRTYCSTKLAAAVAFREVAAEFPEVEVAVVHPGVVRTDLGARKGPLGWLLSLAKRGWESPEACAERLAGVFALPRWSPEGSATWWIEDRQAPWPEVAEDAALHRSVREASEPWLGQAQASGHSPPSGGAAAAPSA